jgi:transposase-like protein
MRPPSGNLSAKAGQSHDADEGRGQPGELTTDEREELRRLRREVKTLQQEREISRKYLPGARQAAAGDRVTV